MPYDLGFQPWIRSTVTGPNTFPALNFDASFRPALYNYQGTTSPAVFYSTTVAVTTSPTAISLGSAFVQLDTTTGSFASGNIVGVMNLGPDNAVTLGGAFMAKMYGSSGMALSVGRTFADNIPAGVTFGAASNGVITLTSASTNSSVLLVVAGNP